jgi:hypothetical protein
MILTRVGKLAMTGAILRVGLIAAETFVVSSNLLIQTA